VEQSGRGTRQTVSRDIPIVTEGPVPPRKSPKRPKRRGRRLVSLLTLLIPLVFLAALTATLCYVRLSHGPISLKFLVGPIERGIEGELGGSQVRIEDALVRLTDSGAVEFRLSNVRLSDRDGQPIASAPLAAVELSGAALWQARVAPSRIELIDPRLLLVYTEEGGLSLSFARSSEEDADPARPDATAGSVVPGVSPGLPAALQRIDLARALAESSARARKGRDASSYLREVGLRNATVVVQQQDGATAWRVPEATIDLEHKQKRSIISGKATIVSGRAPWSFTFRTEESEKSQTIVVEAALNDLVPRTLARALPQLGLLDGFDLPVGGKATFELSRAGDVLAGALSLEIARGRVQLPWVPDVNFAIDAGLVDLRYHRDRARIEMAPSTLRWGQSRITLVGSLSSQRAAGGEGWAFDVRAIEGAIAAEEFGVRQIPLETWSATGTAAPERRHLELTKFELKAGGAEIALSGVIDAPREIADASFEGKIGPIPVQTLKAIWPRALAPGARTWVGERVTRGRIHGGTFRWLSGRYLEKQDVSPRLPEQRLSLAVEASDILMRPMRTMSPIEVPRALVRLEGGAVEVSGPDATILVSNTKRVPLKGGRFTAVDIFNDRPQGEIVFRVTSPLGPVLEVIDQEPLNLVRQAGIGALEGIDGKVDGQIKLSLPLVTDVEASEVKAEGKLRLTEGRAKQLIGPYDVQGATVNLDFADRLAEAKGDMLVSGVPTKIVWQRNTDASGAKLSQIKLITRLDNSDRNQLGLDINHIVQGEVPVEVTVTPVDSPPGAPAQDPRVQLRADLTNAEMILETIAWRKRPGSRAELQVDILRSKGRTELTDLQIRGDNITADGQIVIGPDNRLRELNFPSFTLDLVTQLEMQGAVRSDGVLDVKVKGRHFEGREFFRALFSLGQVSEKPLQPQKARPGLDLTAEIETLAGFSDVSLRGLKLRVSKRADRLVAVDARGTLDGGKPLAVSLVNTPNEPRRLRADSTDAGQAMRLVGFYPNMQGGRVRLEVNLDGKGLVEKTGTLWVESFRILGDPVASEVLGSTETGAPPERRTGKKQVTRQVFDFDRMMVPFSVGTGQFVMEDSYMRGALMGVSLRGKVDFKAGRMNVGGTYVPLQGLNNVLGGIPLLGQIVSGPRGEGIFGITFAVQGSMQQPQVIVNPLSLVTPGIFRSMMEMTGGDQRITPREEAKPQGGPQVRSAGPQGEKSAPSPGSAPETAPRGVKPEVSGAWSSQSSAPTPAPPKR
jgi:hypothetical protein